MKKKYYDARHNCWCYLLREGGAVRYSDDGEPQGTAGQPMLNVFQREEIWNVCCVVTRYFGGILLGAGGLTRAYTRGARDALCAAGCAVMGLWTLWDVPCTYPLFERMKLEIAACGGVVRDAEYGADIVLRARNSCPVPGRISHEKKDAPAARPFTSFVVQRPAGRPMRSAPLRTDPSPAAAGPG